MPETLLDKAIDDVNPEQKLCEDGVAMVLGIGLTVIVKFVGVPAEQPGLAGVAVIVEVIGVSPELTPVKDAIFPVPLAANPIEVLLLVQLKVVPDIELEKAIAVVLEPTQIDWLETVEISGDAFTVTFVNDIKEQVVPDEMVIVYVPDIAVVAFVIVRFRPVA